MCKIIHLEWYNVGKISYARVKELSLFYMLICQNTAPTIQI